MPAAEILGWKRSKYWRPILHSSKSPETPWKSFWEIIKKYSVEEIPEGATHHPWGWGARPTSLGAPPCLVGHLAALRCPCSVIWGLLPKKKNQKQAYGMKLRRHEAEPWRNQSRAPAELFCRGNFPLGGGNHHHRHHQRSSHREGGNLHQHLDQHHLLSNPSSALVSNLCTKTSDWYLWVASSVDYSL